MADILSILRANYTAVGESQLKPGKYVNVEPEKFEGTWSGKYANNDRYSVQISNISGFRAKVKYESGTITKYQEVLIKDNSFRVGDTKFTLVRDGVAQIKTVVTNPATGGQSLESSFAQQN